MNNNNVLFNNHPLTKNSNQYFYETKYLSIQSQDRDIIKYPLASEFEITLPQEYLNVASARLFSWSFPANYNVFSILNYNLSMTFKMKTLYDPSENNVSDILYEAIFAALNSNIDKEYIITIEPGFYNPDQMATELTNKFNSAVTNAIDIFLNDPVNAKYSAAIELFNNNGGYNRFKIIYNSVAQKLWFGNQADGFILTNDSMFFSQREFTDTRCLRKNQLPEANGWGLPYYLGFNQCSISSLSVNNVLNDLSPLEQTLYSPSIDINLDLPRFFFGDVAPNSGDNGYWLLPGAPGATVQFLQATFKINFMGPAYMYMEIDGMNCIDETSPWNLSEYTIQNNVTNGVVNSCFAKIAIPTTPLSQWFDNGTGPYKYWNPPAERISKLKIKIRYHNGVLVRFDQFDYSFTLEFGLLTPQQERSYSIRDSYKLDQLQTYSSKYI